ncbi:hypothetical protein [Corynebacterium tuscaniense]|nr:hypothetical protein [Corynebacterium tuscaniense]
MNPFAALVAGLTNPIETLASFDAQVLRDTGCSPARVREWAKLHKVYYGKTTFTRKQTDAIKVARSTQKSLDQLVYIESRISSVEDPQREMAAAPRVAFHPGGL